MASKREHKTKEKKWKKLSAENPTLQQMPNILLDQACDALSI